ncbi:hypothetical protein [Actinosynnema pretiosum]|nr:hypothetical protein [Actinosynnema pretiosum]
MALVWMALVRAALVWGALPCGTVFHGVEARWTAVTGTTGTAGTWCGAEVDGGPVSRRRGGVGRTTGVGRATGFAARWTAGSALAGDAGDAESLGRNGFLVISGAGLVARWTGAEAGVVGRTSGRPVGLTTALGEARGEFCLRWAITG